MLIKTFFAFFILIIIIITINNFFLVKYDNYNFNILLPSFINLKIIYAKENYGKSLTKLISDGDITNFDDIMKSLALGADAIMSGFYFLSWRSMWWNWFC